MSYVIGKVLESPNVSQMSREYIYGNREDQRFIPCTVAEGNGTPNGNFGRVRGGTVMTRMLSIGILPEDTDFMVRPYQETSTPELGLDATEIEVLNADALFPGDAILIGDPDNSPAQAFIVSKVGNVLTLDDEYTWDEGAPVVLAREGAPDDYVPCVACGILYMDVDTWLRRDYSGNHVYTSVAAKLHIAGSVVRNRLIGLGPDAEAELRSGSGTNILFHVINSNPFDGGR